MKTYKIIRYFQDDARKRKVLQTGLTLEQAQEYCNCCDTDSEFWEEWDESDENPEGPGVIWFDGYEEEKN